MTPNWLIKITKIVLLAHALLHALSYNIHHTRPYNTS
jgi:hypothetical protein